MRSGSGWHTMERVTLDRRRIRSMCEVVASGRHGRYVCGHRRAACEVPVVSTWTGAPRPREFD